MPLETIVRCDLGTGSFELEWENSGNFLHLLCHHPKLTQPLGVSLDSRERQNFLQIVRQAQKLQGQPLEQVIRLGALPPRPARLRLSMTPGPLLLLEAVSAGRQLFEVALNSRSTLRAFIHLLSETQDGGCQEVEGELEEASAESVRLGSHSGTWNPYFSHVLGPEGEWLPLEELSTPVRLRGSLNESGVWERLSLERSPTLAEPQRLACDGLYWQAEVAFESSHDGPGALGQAYLAVQRGPLSEAPPFLEKARELSAYLSEKEESLLLELETYLLCQDGPGPIHRVAQNMQKLVARQITLDPWAARRALSNWRVFLDLLYDGQVPPVALQVWQGWLTQLPRGVHTPTLAFARPSREPATKPQASGPPPSAQVLPPERSLAAPLVAIGLALVLGMWWRWKHPVQWDVTKPTPTSQHP